MTSKDGLVDRGVAVQQQNSSADKRAVSDDDEASSEHFLETSEAVADACAPNARTWQPSPMGSWVVIPAMFGLRAAHEVNGRFTLPDIQDSESIPRFWLLVIRAHKLAHSLTCSIKVIMSVAPTSPPPAGFAAAFYSQVK